MTFTPAFRHRPDKVILHVPEADGLKTITLNGKTVRPVRGRVVVPIDH